MICSSIDIMVVTPGITLNDETHGQCICAVHESFVFMKSEKLQK